MKYTISNEIRNAFMATGVTEESLVSYEDQLNSSPLINEPIEKLNEIIDAIKKKQENKMKSVAFAEAIMRLHENEDFVKVFEDGYFSDEKNRLADLLSSDMPMEKNQRDDVSDQLVAMGRIRRFFSIKTEILFDESEKSDDIKDELDIEFMSFVIDSKKGK